MAGVVGDEGDVEEDDAGVDGGYTLSHSDSGGGSSDLAGNSYN